MASAANFVSEVTSYTTGDIFIADDTSFADTSAAIGSPAPTIGSGVYETILNPFNPPFENTNLVAIGRGGSITMRFGQAVPVNGETKVGIFTAVGLWDVDYPNGAYDVYARSFAYQEYLAERTAIVEVGDSAGNFVSLGRITFDDPTNYYANSTSGSQFPAPADPVVADFSKPFEASQEAADQKYFHGLDYAGGLALLDGSAGGTWIPVPESIGLSEIAQVRLSDTMWRLDTGDLEESRTGIYPPPYQYTKPADLFIDAAVAIPEPALAGSLAGLMLVALRRRVSR